MGYCSKCKGIMLATVGLAILANEFVLGWPWWTFIGALFVVMGSIRAMKPCCPCPGGDAAPAGKKKRR